MSATELKETLETALATERALSLSIHNIIQTFTWSGLPRAKQREVARSLETMAAAPQRRAERIQQLIARA